MDVNCQHLQKFIYIIYLFFTFFNYFYIYYVDVNCQHSLSVGLYPSLRILFQTPFRFDHQTEIFWPIRNFDENLWSYVLEK